MVRRDKLFDQDEPETPDAPPPGSSGRQRSGRLFDQDVPAGPVAPPPRSASAESERRRERELELRREQELEREREARRQRARLSQNRNAGPGGAPAPPSRPASGTPPPFPPRPNLAPPNLAPPTPAPPTPAPGSAPARPPSPAPSGRRGSSRPGPRHTARHAAPRRPATPSGSLGRSSAVMAGGTLLSRLTGFARVLLVATILGTNGLGDAYNLANSVPNIVYDLLVGGILSATLVPVFVDEFARIDRGESDRKEGDRAIAAVLTAIVVALIAVSALLYVFAPLVLRFYLLLNHSHSAGPEQAIGTDLLHLFAPQVLLLGAIVVSTALLNARRRFAAAAFSPVANNLVAIAAIVATRMVATSFDLGRFAQEHQALLVLGLGTTLGYAVQLALQVPAMRRARIRLRPVWDLRHPAVRRVGRLSLWLIGVVVANQISFNVILVYAASKSGGATIYNTAYQFFQLPYSLFTVSLASALTPDLAERWSGRDLVGFRRRIIASLRLTLAVLVPAAASYVVVAHPLITLAVDYGHVTAAAANAIGSSLEVFALGLPGFSVFVLLIRGFQAMQDTRTMFWMYAMENALSLVGAVVLYPSMGVPGLALAWVAPYSVMAVPAAVRLQRRTGALGGALTMRALTRIGLAGAVMVAVLVGLGEVFPVDHGHLELVVRLAVQIGGGGGAYLLAVRALGIAELDALRRLIRRSG
ncbi:MAG: murein biosynthesis integral membrane protein MurJ [Acidimicrobiales bacterium]